MLALGSNPTTGFRWEASFDDTTLKLVDKTYEPRSAPAGMVGVGGTEYFRFRALRTGETVITMIYQRSWEKQLADRKRFTVTIK